jgi:hypothetical protein
MDTAPEEPEGTPSALAAQLRTEDFDVLLNELVHDSAPRLFAVVQVEGERIDGWVAAWGMAFDDEGIATMRASARSLLSFLSSRTTPDPKGIATRRRAADHLQAPWRVREQRPTRRARGAPAAVVHRCIAAAAYGAVGGCSSPNTHGASTICQPSGSSNRTAPWSFQYGFAGGTGWCPYSASRRTAVATASWPRR